MHIQFLTAQHLWQHIQFFTFVDCTYSFHIEQCSFHFTFHFFAIQLTSFSYSYCSQMKWHFDMAAIFSVYLSAIFLKVTHFLIKLSKEFFKFKLQPACPDCTCSTANGTLVSRKWKIIICRQWVQNHDRICFQLRQGTKKSGKVKRRPDQNSYNSTVSSINLRVFTWTTVLQKCKLKLLFIV